jgi:hypothetical protein
VRLITSFMVSVAVMVGGESAHANDPCAAFTWDVRHERTLFAKQPESAVAGEALVTSPTLVTDKLYQLTLKGQSEVIFAAPPGRKPPSDGTYGGLARLTVDRAGVYRVSLDQPLWVDVVANGTVLQAKDFQGRKDCNGPHKIVEFVLPAATPMTLQFSGGLIPTVKITVTHDPTQSP